MAIFSPIQNPDDLASVEKYLRERSDAELTQISTSPFALVGRLSGFTQNHVGTMEGSLVSNLAKAEANRRAAARMRLVSWLAVAVSGVSALTAVASAVAAYFAHR